MQKITNNVYLETDFRGCNPGFVVTNEGVVMIDTPQIPLDAIRWRDEITKHGTVRYVINTEPHGDHFTGNHFFEGTVVAHEGTREIILATPVEHIKERLQEIGPDSIPLLEGFSYRPPTITLSQQLTLYLGNHTFHLINLPGHTPYQVAVYIPEERVVFTGDNFTHGQQPKLTDCCPLEWVESLKRIAAMDVDVIVPGHGEIGDKKAVRDFRTFIEVCIDTVRKAMNQGMSEEEAADKISFESEAYPPPLLHPGPEQQRDNIARLYKMLKK